MLISPTLALFAMHALFYVTSVSGHSWITCTDYMEENGEYWDDAHCRAFPRHASQFAPRGGQFGRDTGYDVAKPPDASPCRTSRNDIDAYDNQHPMAVYFSGQNVVITHPTKNHVADVRCTNKYIPDNGNRIWISARDATSDVTLTEFRSNLLVDFGVAPFGHEVLDDVTTTYPKAGFQNAPKFCENTDKALATNAFIVPDLQPGRYTMLWGWSFNNAEDLYTSCWEVDIVASRTERDQVLNARGQSTADPVNIATGIIAPTPAPVTPAPVPPPTQALNPNPNPNPNPNTNPAMTPPPSTDSSTYYTRTGIPGSNPGTCVCQCPITTSGSSHVVISVTTLLTSLLVYTCAISFSAFR